MKIQLGDKVLVKDDVIRGVVTKLEGDYIFLEEENGFEFKYHKNQIIVIAIEQSELSKFSDINNQMLKQKMALKDKAKSSVKKSKQEKYGVVMEVDLHIEKLVKSKKGMSNADILNRQLDTAEHKIQFAIKNRIPKIVLIHGVGEGVLKEELYRLLKRYPTRFTEASYQKYGYGATEVAFV